ncbi:hypothetical protein ABEB36_015821 [Hypothenemus hampei]|uniref:Uncharacterized protein n=1 Tax=Hypothenemus hampei TaxID=57062 RepID=A0ABD1DZF9_HYPHA
MMADDKIQLSNELNSLLEALVNYKFIFDARVSDKIPSSLPRTITVKLNKARTLLCLDYNNNEFEIENNDKIIKKTDYDNVRNTLKDKRTLIHENKWNESFKLVKQQILSYLIKQNELEDRENFLKEFQQFIDKLPEVPHEFIDCTRKLKEINFNDWDIEESEANDPRLQTLEEIHKKC